MKTQIFYLVCTTHFSCKHLYRLGELVSLYHRTSYWVSLNHLYSITQTNNIRLKICCSCKRNRQKKSLKKRKTVKSNRSTFVYIGSIIFFRFHWQKHERQNYFFQLRDDLDTEAESTHYTWSKHKLPHISLYLSPGKEYYITYHSFLLLVHHKKMF